MRQYTQALPCGTKLRKDGAYEILKVLGQGGFGITYLAKSNLHPQVAIKEFFPHRYCQRHESKVLPIPGFSEEFDFEQYRNKFLEEAKQLTNFDHPNIVKIQDFFKDQNTAYFVMRFEEGSTLHDIVSERLYLAEKEALQIIKEIAYAIQPVHEKGILHRDIKPTNIIVRKDGSSVLIDFGAAREITDGSLIHTAIFSHGFAPPEQYNESGAKGKTLDIYALGATLYYCVSGKKPIRADKRSQIRLVPPIEINPKICEKTNDLILKAMSINPVDRFQNVSELLYELATISPNQTEPRSFSGSQIEALKIVEQFISDEESNVLILNGCVGSGKTTLISKINDISQRLNYSARNLTIGNRIAEYINQKLGLDISSIYRQIFTFENGQEKIRNSSPVKIDLVTSEIKKDDLQQSKFDIRKNEDPLQTIYIVDEAQLLSDDYSENDFFIFGSGRLLHDLIDYSEIQVIGKRKLIFIGDLKQLTWGNKDESALVQRNLENVYQLKCRYYELEDIVCEGAQKNITFEAAKVRAALSNSLYNRLDVNVDGQSIYKIKNTAFKEHYCNIESINSTIVLTYSNEQALKVNKYVRKILGKTGTIAKGDWIIFHNTVGITDYTSDFISYIYKGEIAEVIDIDAIPEKFVQNLRGKQEVLLNYRKIKINLPRLGRQHEILILENFLQSERELSKDEQTAMLARAKKDFHSMNGQKSVSQVEFGVFLQNNKYYNAGMVKFAYAITCHRALGIKWQNVLVNCETNKGKESDEYFRWLYSAITRATDKVYLLNDVVITPFSKLEWKDNPNVYDEFNKVRASIFNKSLNFNLPSEAILSAVKHKFPKGESHLRNFWFLCYQKLKEHDATIEKIEHKSYHEVYTFKDQNGNRAVIKFYYNSQNMFTKYQIHSKSTLTKKIMEILNTQSAYVNVTNDDFEESFLHELYQKLFEKTVLSNIHITQLEHSKYHEKYTFLRDSQMAKLHFFYDNAGFITSVIPVKYNSIEILEDLQEIVLKKIRFGDE